MIKKLVTLAILIALAAAPAVVNAQDAEPSPASELTVTWVADSDGVGGMYIFEWVKGTHPHRSEEILHWREQNKEYIPANSVKLGTRYSPIDYSRVVQLTDAHYLATQESIWDNGVLKLGSTYVVQVSSHYCLTCTLPANIGNRVEYGRSNEVTITTPPSPGSIHSSSSETETESETDPVNPTPTELSVESDNLPIVLTWIPGESDTGSPYVEQLVVRGDVERSVGADVSRFTDTDPLQEGTTYSYRVRGVRADSTKGPLSEAVEVTVAEDQFSSYEPPGPAPTYTTFESHYGDNLVLIWRPGVSDTDSPYVKQWILRRVIGESSGWTKREVGADVRRFVETDDIRQDTPTEYRYRIRGIRADGTKGPLGPKMDVIVAPDKTYEYDEYGRRVPKD